MKATISQLEYIIALDIHQHFGKAADRCFVTQPTLSMQINKLEENLGVRIFDRSRQPVVPTSIGKAILEQARKIVNETKKLEELIDEQKDILSGALKVAILPTLAPYLIPFFVSSFLKNYPDVILSIEELKTDDTLKKLNNEEIDVGIVASPVEDSAVREIPLFYEKFMVYAYDTELPNDRTLSNRDLDMDRLWLLNERHFFRQQVLNICKNRNNKNILNYQSGSLEALKQMVDKQGGVTLLPELATLGLSAADSHKIYSFKTPQPHREVSLVLKRDYLKKE